MHNNVNFYLNFARTHFSHAKTAHLLSYLSMWNNVCWPL